MIVIEKFRDFTNITRRCNVSTDETMALIRAELKALNNDPSFINRISSGIQERVYLN
jgi:hypothetical protein